MHLSLNGWGIYGLYTVLGISNIMGGAFIPLNGWGTYGLLGWAFVT